jgi:Ni/Co efflux regulator RcnB
MKKLLVLLAMVLAFTFTSVAQTSTSSSTGQADKSATKSKTKKSDDSGAMSDSKGKAKKEATLTGCLSSDGTMLTNGRYKKGAKVGPEDKVKAHAGHQVQLTGEWKGTGADKSFEVASVKHISDTCKEAPGGGTTGTTKKGEKDMKKGKDTGTTPPKS